MTVLIENYRGFDIMFEPDTERFTCLIDPGHWQDKQSFAAAKRFVDDHIKENLTFEHFIAQSLDTGGTIKVTGLRKDGRFVYDLKGKKEQLSEWNEKDYVVYNPDNEKYYAEIASLKADISVLEDKVRLIKKGINGEKLSAIKEKYKGLIS